MSYLLLALLLIFPSMASAEMKTRIWYMPDGTVRLTIPAKNACYKGEMENVCSQRIFTRTKEAVPELRPVFTSGEFDDLDRAALPSFADRKYWKGTKATGITIDTAARAADIAVEAEKNADKNSGRGKLRGLGLTSAEIDAMGIK